MVEQGIQRQLKPGGFPRKKVKAKKNKKFQMKIKLKMVYIVGQYAWISALYPTRLQAADHKQRS
jgi:hypothetical protein